MTHRPLVFCLFCILLVAILPAFAQSGRATIDSPDHLLATNVNGVVSTLDGKPMSGVHVELQQIPTAHVVASGYTLINGSFEFLNVLPGRYEIVATEGLQQTREMVQVREMVATVEIRMGSASPATAGNTVSVAQMQVPDKARKELHKAEESLHKRKTDDARQHVKKALEIAPQYAAALTLNGILDLGENQFDQARATCEQAIRFDPNYGMGYVVLGASYNSLARFDAAVRSLERGLALLPQSWQGHFELAKALLGKARYQESLQQIDRAAELVPSSYPAVHLLRAHALLGLKNYSDAITELERYLGGAPNGLDAASARETLDQARAFAATRSAK